MPSRVPALFLLTLIGVSSAYSANSAPVAQVGFALRGTSESNVFLQEDTALAPGQTVAALPARAQDFQVSSTLSLAFEWQLSPELKFEAGYAPQVVRYARFASENHDDHRINVAITGTSGAWSAELRGSALLTDGSTESPVFNRLGGAPCIGGEPVRSRRAQDCFRYNAKVTRTGTKGFLRAVFASLEQDFHTAERATPGYANYIDRSEVSGGIDAGWYLRNHFALVAGTRTGRQHQALLLGNPLNSDNTFLRCLVGCEGSPVRHLKLSLLAGPDRRHYGAQVASTFVRRRTTVYGEGCVTWTAGSADTLVITGKRYDWLSAGGRTAYADLVADLTWKHRFNADWSGQFGFNHHTGDSCRFQTSSPRDEIIDSTRLALTRRVGAVMLEAAWLHEWTKNSIVNTPGRSFRREVVSLGGTRSW